ncbi:hypothetical protein NQ314_020363 [Rhamnusium bicolor]|uniref:DNA helicase n=1 Tax=Rhamnusium bicolor TaxID=1586634 RepID=A0AAV8WKB8_9CUCU|nr:hypothetical protein NQ314_020363 [Rhamnusium bicolor]
MFIGNNCKLNSIHNSLNSYTDIEFPKPKDDETVVYSIPKHFSSTGERQAALAESQVFQRLHGLVDNTRIGGLWVLFFHSTCYAGQSYRNQRMGRLMIREHDFVVFAKCRGQFYVALIEVKSNNDSNTKMYDLEKTSDAKVIKNNKRSAQHQLRDHMEVLQRIIGNEPVENNIQTYIIWPFLGAYTKDPRQQIIKRWKEDKNLHVFEDVIAGQDSFIILSSGVFMNEINDDLLGLLTQQQLEILNSDVCTKEHGGPLVVYGAAGTGKTLLVLRKLDQLHRTGRLNDQNRALFICYWPGIRTEVTTKLKAMGIASYVDTARYYISMGDFLRGYRKKYKHIFMDEAEAVCISFHQSIIKETISAVYSHYHDGNCSIENCQHATLEKHHSKDWGELWFMIDANQAQLFLPRHYLSAFRTPTIILSKIMRSTKCIFNIFKEFYNDPVSKLPMPTTGNIVIPNLSVGHKICGPPVYWVRFEKNIDETIATVIIDLCATKGIKPNDICVIPFMQNEYTVAARINKYIEEYFVENTFKPKCVSDVENFLTKRELNDFLISWALRVKGLEFTIVIMAIDDYEFDMNDLEDRRKAYIMSSRCTCMLIFICNDSVRTNMRLEGISIEYPFNLEFDIKTQHNMPNVNKRTY